MDKKLKSKKLKYISKRMSVNGVTRDEDIELLYFVVHHFGFLDGLSSIIQGKVDVYGFYGHEVKTIFKSIALTDDDGIRILVETDNDEETIVKYSEALEILVFLRTVFKDEIESFQEAERNGQFMVFTKEDYL